MNLLSRPWASRMDFGPLGMVPLVAAAAIAVSCAARGMSLLVALRGDLPIAGPVWRGDGRARFPVRSAEPWGQLKVRDLWLERPDEFNRWRSLSREPVRWVLDGLDGPGVAGLLKRCGVPAELRARLLGRDCLESGAGGSVLHPDDSLVLALSRGVRAKLYNRLARNPANPAQAKPLLFPGDSRAAVFARSGLPSEAARRATELLYRRGDALCLSDLPALLRSLPSDADRRAAARAAGRHRAVLAALVIRADTPIEPLVGYWGRDGRAKDLAPLLESCRRAPGGVDLDLIHLLPPFARERLETHPFPADSESDRQRDCHWSALNFARVEPDDRFLELDEVVAELKRNYYPIEEPGQLGDVILMCNAAGQAVHSCAYVADDIVFTKNGHHHLQPWVLARLADVELGYATGHGRIRRQVYRRRQ